MSPFCYMLTKLYNSFTVETRSKYLLKKLSLKVPPLLEHIATIPCEISGTFLTHNNQQSGSFLAPPCRCTKKLD